MCAADTVVGLINPWWKNGRKGNQWEVCHVLWRTQTWEASKNNDWTSPEYYETQDVLRNFLHFAQKKHKHTYYNNSMSQFLQKHTAQPKLTAKLRNPLRNVAQCLFQQSPGQKVYQFFFFIWIEDKGQLFLFTINTSKQFINKSLQSVNNEAYSTLCRLSDYLS